MKDNGTFESIFKVIHYRYEVSNKRRLRYPRFRVFQIEIFYFKTFDEVNDYMQREASFYKSLTLDDKYLDTYAYVIIELPLGREANCVLDVSLSVWIYQRDGTLWGKNSYAHFFPRGLLEDEWNFWGRKNMFLGRGPEEIRFKPGDIVEILGYPGNGYWSEDEVNLAIIVKAPPTIDEVAVMRQHYMETHSGFDLCDHAQNCILFNRHLDTYEVLSFACEGIDHASTISVFEPTKAVSTRRKEALRHMHNQYMTELST